MNGKGWLGLAAAAIAILFVWKSTKAVAPPGPIPVTPTPAPPPTPVPPSADPGTFIVVLTNLPPPYTTPPGSFLEKAYGHNPPGGWGAGLRFWVRGGGNPVALDATNISGEFVPIAEGVQYIFNLNHVLSSPYYQGRGYFGGNLWWLLADLPGYAMAGPVVGSDWFTPVDQRVYVFDVLTGSLT
jgi:hypothetical protein